MANPLKWNWNEMCLIYSGSIMSCLVPRFFLETKEGSQKLHGQFHGRNAEESYALIRISSFSLTQNSRFQGEQVYGKCVLLYVFCVCMGEGPLVGHDSFAWIKCGTLIWVKIMESYMSLNMSAFHSRPKWKVMAGRCRRGRGQKFWNGNQVTMRLSLRLTRSQAETGLAAIKH